jgi:hypothetical protein
MPDAPFYSDLTLSFNDTLTISGASSGFLSLDVSVHGVLHQPGGNGDYAIGRFGVLTENTDETVISNFGSLCMFWSGPNPPGYCTELPLGPLAPLKSAMTINPDGLGNVIYQGEATIFIPFSGNTFEFQAALSSSSLCHAPCSAKTDLGHTALIGGVKILDSSMNQISGATLTSQSGYDYVTPPSGAAAPGVPEPASASLTVGMLGFLVWYARRKTRNGRAAMGC